MVRLPDGEKNCEMFIRFDVIHERDRHTTDRQTDGQTDTKKLLPVRTGLVAKSITSPEMFRYSMACSRTCALLAVHAHC